LITTFFTLETLTVFNRTYNKSISGFKARAFCQAFSTCLCSSSACSGPKTAKQDNLTMIQIAADLAKLYTSFIEQKGVEKNQE